MEKTDLTLEEIKQHLNVDHDLDDDLIENYKVATFEEITTDTQQTIIPMTIKSLWDVYREPCAY